MRNKLPVIDISALKDSAEEVQRQIGRSLCEASEDQGFFYITGHSVDHRLLTDVFDVAQRFFCLSDAEKSKIKTSDTHRGFLQIGQSTMEGYSGADLKESFIWGRENSTSSNGSQDASTLVAVNRWYRDLPEMKELLNRYFDAIHDVAGTLLTAIAIALNQPQNYFTQHFGSPTSRGSLIYYPIQNGASDGYGVSPHTDFGCLSILAQGAPGLRVQAPDGNWFEVEPIENALVVNVGDLLTRWTNGKFRSVPHCVVNQGSEARYSVVVFVDPDSQTMIDPIVEVGQTQDFEPVTCEAYITQRFDRSFAYRQ